MSRSKNPILSQVAIAIAMFAAPGCDAGDDSQSDADSPRQFIQEGITLEQATEVLQAADAESDISVADFYIHRPEGTTPASGNGYDNGNGYSLLPNDCHHTIESITALGVSDCYCMRDGNILCIDFSWWDEMPLTEEPEGSYPYPGE
jgi:hypothetical protein